MVMVAHACYPRVTEDHVPASLSKEWISNILRKKIDFPGLIVSDDLEMGGVLASGPIEEAAIRTLLAGSDLMLVCHKEQNVWRAYEAVYKRAEQDRRFAKLIHQKARRVMNFKEKSSEMRARPAPRPTPRTVDRLCRRIWEFTEEVRLTRNAETEKDRPKDQA